MFDRFTDRARKVMGLSRQEAQRFNHDYIGTEHLLLGFIREEAGIAAQALRSVGVRLDDARDEVQGLLGSPEVGVGDRRPVQLMGIEELPSELGARIREIVEERGRVIGDVEVGDEVLVIAFAPKRDPMRMFNLGFAVGERRRVVLLHLPGERIELMGVTPLEVNDDLPRELAALLRHA